jgi:hypothetical protein
MLRISQLENPHLVGKSRNLSTGVESRKHRCWPQFYSQNMSALRSADDIVTSVAMVAAWVAMRHVGCYAHHDGCYATTWNDEGD